MDIKTAIKFMTVEQAIELEQRRFFVNADETINTISIYSMEKQIPVKPKIMPQPLKNERHWWVCGACGANHHTNFRDNYCRFCGQRVDWSEHLQNSKHYVPDDVLEHAKMTFPELEERDTE